MVLISLPPLRVIDTPRLYEVHAPRVDLAVDKRTGEATLRWQGQAALPHLYGQVRFMDGRLLSTRQKPSSVQGAYSAKGIYEVTVKFRSGLVQRFWVGGSADVRTQLEFDSKTPVSCNRIDALVSNAPAFRHRSPLNSLFVPYDNDAYERYRSDSWGQHKDDALGSSEVGAVYDDGNRNGLVIGSLEHETWKSGVQFKRNGSELSRLDAYAGMAGYLTRDTQPHGAVTGRRIVSPVFVAFTCGDWRTGMEHYADLNAAIQPKLPWPDGVPFGWNSWSGYKEKITFAEAQAATDFFINKLPDFRNGGTAYMNLDSFWDNLSKDQRSQYVMHAHTHGLKAGIYYTPFVCWSGNLNVRVDDTDTLYSEIVMKDAAGKPLPKIDGGWPLDPTNPATLLHIDRQLDEFINLGFDYVKLDFMTHGALEGHHWLSSIQTGNQAYTFAMRHIDAYLSEKHIGRPFFMGLSIAPMFPSGFAHARRISCDAFSNIGATEYLLNSATYGWWTNDRIYAFNDPDSTCIYQPLGEAPDTMGEAYCRFTASVIGGGMMVESDDLLNPKAAERAMKLYTNKEVLDLARRHQAFRPVNGTTGDKAGNAFVLNQPDGCYLAVFNYDKKMASTFRLPVNRLGLGSGSYEVHDLWSGQNSKARGEIKVPLKPMSCVLLHLTKA